MNINRKDRQGGFTLVELAIVMVVIGILLGALLTGQQLIDNARGKQFLADVKGIEAYTWMYYDRKGVFPGDCNGDGLIGVLTVPASTAAGDPAAANALDAVAAAPTTLDCSIAESKDSGIADLRTEKLLEFDATKSNGQVGTHSANGEMTLGTITNAAGTSRNALIFWEVPLWMAQMVDANIDGSVDGLLGRVRTIDNTAVTGAQGDVTDWPATTAAEQTVAFMYLFDKGF
ncbi:MAG: type II secretion system GspH family protein [Gammaproteobacteria bacterium]|nr:type II secretion system GspH family protein [Gammaproteobacteria bacterium]